MNYQQTLESTRRALSSGRSHGREEAVRLWREFLQLAGATEREALLAKSNLAEVLVMSGDPGEARDLFDEAAAGLTDSPDRVWVLCGYANLACSEGDRATLIRTRDLLSDALMMAGGVTCETSPWGYAYLSRLCTKLGDLSAAREAAEKGVSSAMRLVPVRGLAEAYSALSAAQEAQGDLICARDSLEEAMANMSQGHCLMEARARYGRISLALGENETAVRSFSQAVDFADFRDQRVLGHVLQAIASLHAVDPGQARLLTERLAARLLAPPMKRGDS